MNTWKHLLDSTRVESERKLEIREKKRERERERERKREREREKKREREREKKREENNWRATKSLHHLSSSLHLLPTIPSS
jgi:hypothetical protein